MAKAKKSGVNTQLLTGIASGAVTYVTQAEAVEAGLDHVPALIEVNTATDAIVDGKAPVRVTEAGKAFLAPAVTASEPVASPYGIMKGIEIPASKRGNRKGSGAPTQYPFDSMEIGDSFFVPVSAKHPDPVKTLGSTVSSANMRYAVETGEMKTVERTKRGPKNKALIDGNGEKLKETVTVPVHKFMRRFVIRAIQKGKMYGNWTAEHDGALIARVSVE